MPPIIDPIFTQPASKPDDKSGSGTPDVMVNQVSEVVVTIATEIDGIKHTELQLADILITSIPKKEVAKFVDPYRFVPQKRLAEQSEVQPSIDNEGTNDDQEDQDSNKYLLGTHHIKDTEGGDAGCQPKKAKYFPYVEFIRSQFCGKYQNSILHSDVATVGGNPKHMKEYFVTTGLVVAYMNTFDVDIYSIQKPSKETTPGDYSMEYLNRIMVQRKLASKKKNEKSLAQLIKNVQGPELTEEVLRKMHAEFL
jgi:hypothetical protein